MRTNNNPLLSDTKMPFTLSYQDSTPCRVIAQMKAPTHPTKVSVLVCTKERVSGRPSCANRGSEALANLLKIELQQAGWDIPIERILCFGRCQEAPVLRISPGGPFFTEIRAERLNEVVAAVASLTHKRAGSADETAPD
jgi:(2Fe-2S) ferredoxin